MVWIPDAFSTWAVCLRIVLVSVVTKYFTRLAEVMKMCIASVSPGRIFLSLLSFTLRGLLNRLRKDLPGLEFGPVRLRIKRSDKPNTNFYLTNDAAQSIYELSRHWGIEFKDILGWAIVDKYQIEIGDT